MTWLIRFAEAASATDQFESREDHLRLLASGLLGEVGSVVTELKKRARERDAYPAYRRRIVEEVGDLLWYLVRVTSLVDRTLLSTLQTSRSPSPTVGSASTASSWHLGLGGAVGRLVEAIGTESGEKVSDVSRLLAEVWYLLRRVAEAVGVDLEECAALNAAKIDSRWPQRREYRELFDASFPEDEQLPRILKVEFREREYGGRPVVRLRCNNLNFGDRLTDNIEDLDGYRFHDVFHFSHVVHLGWSPVVRALLRCKRKSDPATDESQDGARAVILEEAVAAVVFARAKELAFFDGLQQVDYNLLKSIREIVQGYEVDTIPVWQWETAILAGFQVFRQLRTNRGGCVHLNLSKRELFYAASV